MPTRKSLNVCVIGLGYVGLPLAYHLSGACVGTIFGYDIDKSRLSRICRGYDHTGMVPENVILAHYRRIRWVDHMPPACDVYIICVPTPDKHGIPDYSFVETAMLEAVKAADDDSAIVIESTVAPDVVSKRLLPLLKQHHEDFDPSSTLIAFSPERVNPGPTAFGDMARCAKILSYDKSTYKGNKLGVVTDGVYGAVFDSVVHFEDIRVTALAKCFENMQRDVNIALMNELSMICHREGLELPDVLTALRTKKSSPMFTPGLVGGHCIPVDPYYLAAYYEDIAPHRIQLPIVGRKINEEYLDYLSILAHRECPVGKSILIYGYTYKPDVNDTRNSGGLKIADKLKSIGRSVVCYDPLMTNVDPKDEKEYGVVIGAVKHRNHKVDWRPFNLTIDCKFINIGGAFSGTDTEHFQTIINM